MLETEAQQSAFDIINELLELYGLTELSDFVTNYIVDNDVVDSNVLMSQIRLQPAYETRFAGNTQRRNAGLNVLSEREYVALENTYRQYMRASGLPRDFYDSSEDLQNLIGSDVSPAELAERVNQGYEQVRFADPTVVSQMQELYGVGEGDLAAFFLDPERATPTLLRRAQAAQVAGGAVQAGMQLTAEEAEQLAGEGVTEQTARAGVAAIEQAQELFQATTQETGDFTREEQLGAVFGTDPRAAQRLRQRARQRQAQFEGGGRFAGQGAELTGLQ
tara:strand:- start:457 stop:1284 length:828 start_codon:yes stop_codon:yes gene_type:complete